MLSEMMRYGESTLTEEEMGFGGGVSSSNGKLQCCCITLPLLSVVRKLKQEDYHDCGANQSSLWDCVDQVW